MKYIVNLGKHRKGSLFVNGSTNRPGYLPDSMLPDGFIVTLKEEHPSFKGWFSINEDAYYYPIDLLTPVGKSKTARLLNYVRSSNAC